MFCYGLTEIIFFGNIVFMKGVLFIIDIFVCDDLFSSQFPRFVDEELFVDIEDDCITLHCVSTTLFFRLHHLRLSPVSCRGLRWCLPCELNFSVHANLESQSVEKIASQNSTINYHPGLPRCQDSKFLDCIKHHQDGCCCAACGWSIFASNK